MEIINKVESRILERHENEFLNQWDPLTLNQKKTLELVVLNDRKDMFYANALQKVGLKSGSQVSEALDSLLEKDIVSKNGRYYLQDVMFKKWIERLV